MVVPRFIDMSNQEDFDSLVGALIAQSSKATLDGGLVDSLHSLSVSHEIRDFRWGCGLYSSIYRSLKFLWDVSQDQHAGPLEDKLWGVWEYCLESPEFSDDVASREDCGVNVDWVSQLLDRIVLYATVAERVPVTSLRCAKHCFHWAYTQRVDMRGAMRKLLGARLLGLGSGKGRGRDGGRSRFHVRHLLELLQAVVSGFSSESLPGVRRGLLQQVLLPLHLPGEMIEWRDQVPVLQHYHEALVQCMVRLVLRDRDASLLWGECGENLGASAMTTHPPMLTQAMLGLMRQWPQGFDANTPKEVLLLHELEALISLGAAAPAELEPVTPALLERVVRCIGSDVDNIRPAQRALQLFKCTAFLDMLRSKNLTAALRVLIPPLFRGGALSWNPTVNKMTGLALQALQALDPSLFARVAEEVVGGGGGGAGAGVIVRMQEQEPALPKRQREPVGGQGDGPAAEKDETKGPPAPPVAMSKPLIPRAPAVAVGGMRPPQLGLVAGAGGWRPGSGQPPPVTVTGVAPWAHAQAKSAGPMGGSGGRLDGVHALMPRPLLPAGFKSAGRESVVGDAVAVDSKSGMEVVKEDVEDGDDDNDCKTRPPPRLSGREVLEEYIKKCLPVDREQANDPSSDWNQVQAAASPTLLPSLRFHDLVFGQQLGEGAFSTVRYARRIRRESSQSYWPEYAVKVISGERMRLLGYHASVEREMAVLHVLSHPGVSRLISAFRYTGSAYLVLEYAARGDLHSYILSLGGGGLGHLPARFVLGEVCAALLHVHELGFSYNDLKPENVLITALGHIKLADFGACRPLNAAAQGLLLESLKNVGCLRNGDWREGAADAVAAGGAAGEAFPNLGDGRSKGDTLNAGVDVRAEGTPAFLPPEVLSGQHTPGGLGSDAWALGCLAYFCLVGRPLFFGDREQVLDQLEQQLGASSSGAGFVPVRHAGELGTAPPQGAPAGRVNFDMHGAGGGGGGGAVTAVLKSLASDEHVRAFLQGLLCAEPCDRLTVRDAALHKYLLLGLCGVEGEGELQSPLEPLKLHFGRPITLPEAGPAARGERGRDDPWARRQFSVLWAPMPAEYDLGGGAGTGGEAGAALHRCVGPSRRLYSLTAVEETATESHCAFL